MLYRLLADTWAVYDNSGGNPKLLEVDVLVPFA